MKELRRRELPAFAHRSLLEKFVNADTRLSVAYGN